MPSSTGFWIGDESGHYDDPALAMALVELFRGCSVLDLGCGNGFYVQEFRHAGLIAEGVDGNPATKVGRVFDLTQPLDLGSWDWVLSLEVGEHIPMALADAFLGNVTRHASKGVVLSWGVPGNGPGHGHVNEQSNAWVRGQMVCRGFQPAFDLEERLRAASSLPWFSRTLMTFRRV